MEVAWSKVGAIRRMLEDFPLEILQRLICLVGSMGMRVFMQEQQWEVLKTILAPIRNFTSILTLKFVTHWFCMYHLL
jgi:hypothetical protein